jgi:hypothetical protein
MEELAAKADLISWLYVTAEAVTHKTSRAATQILDVGLHGCRGLIRFGVARITIHESQITIH